MFNKSFLFLQRKGLSGKILTKRPFALQNRNVLAKTVPLKIHEGKKPQRVLRHASESKSDEENRAPSPQVIKVAPPAQTPSPKKQVNETVVIGPVTPTPLKKAVSGQFIVPAAPPSQFAGTKTSDPATPSPCKLNNETRTMTPKSPTPHKEKDATFLTPAPVLPLDETRIITPAHVGNGSLNFEPLTPSPPRSDMRMSTIGPLTPTPLRQGNKSQLINSSFEMESRQNATYLTPAPVAPLLDETRTVTPAAINQNDKHVIEQSSPISPRYNIASGTAGPLTPTPLRQMTKPQPLALHSQPQQKSTHSSTTGTATPPLPVLHIDDQEIESWAKLESFEKNLSVRSSLESALVSVDLEASLPNTSIEMQCKTPSTPEREASGAFLAPVTPTPLRESSKPAVTAPVTPTPLKQVDAAVLLTPRTMRRSITFTKLNDDDDSDDGMSRKPIKLIDTPSPPVSPTPSPVHLKDLSSQTVTLDAVSPCRNKPLFDDDDDIPFTQAEDDSIPFTQPDVDDIPFTKPEKDDLPSTQPEDVDIPFTHSRSPCDSIDVVVPPVDELSPVRPCQQDCGESSFQSSPRHFLSPDSFIQGAAPVPVICVTPCRAASGGVFKGEEASTPARKFLSPDSFLQNSASHLNLTSTPTSLLQSPGSAIDKSLPHQVRYHRTKGFRCSNGTQMPGRLRL